MNTIFGATFVGRRLVEVLSASCSRENVGGETFSVEVFCSLRSHGTRFAYGRLRAQALSQPCLVMGRARCVERFVFATNGAIERFGNLVRQELISLTRHTIVANATIETVPCHGKSGCLRLRSN